VKNKTGQCVIWAIALLITVRLVFTAHQHQMPIADTLVIVCSVPLAASAGLEALARGIRATRKGATR
jgi:hypothetical protein